MRGYNVLSLFGGIETGYAALKDAGVPIENYWSSEIDKNAVKVSAHNYPQIVHLGDVKGVSVANIPFVPDLLIAGFPCTDLSFAGKQGGFDNDRSGLFFEAVRVLRECQAVNPNVLFLFENVPMAKRHEWVINEMLGLRPWANNAALVSAQNRNRLWWSNIRTKKVGLFDELHTDFPQPKDIGVMLADILEGEVGEKYYLSGAALARIERSLYSKPAIDPEKAGTVLTRNNIAAQRFDSGTTLIGVVNDNGSLRKVEKSNCIDANFHKGMDNHGQRTLIHQTARGNNPGGERAQNGKTPCVGANAWQNNNHVIAHNLMPRNGKGKGGKGHLSKTDGKSYCCDTGQTNAVEIFCHNPKRTEYGKAVRKDYEAGKIEGAKRSDMAAPQPRDDGKAGTITTVEKDNTLQVGPTLRRLTPVEVCRLFTLPDNLFQGENGPIIAETNQYKALGNGWVMKVVSHIFSFLPELS